ncbi:unnamed protein product [Sphagnum troendelagicum]
MGTLPLLGSDSVNPVWQGSNQELVVMVISIAFVFSLVNYVMDRWSMPVDLTLNRISTSADCLCMLLDGAGFFAANASAHASRRSSPRVHNRAVQEASAALKTSDHCRANPVGTRLEEQRKHLNLPILPTTTIGSFPQTASSAVFAGRITEQDYEKAIKAEIDSVVKLQEELDIDVLVHGEPEPPIIFGDVSWPKAMTVFWSQYAQSVTKHPMKGMLTGPVTILNWSFVRNDQARFTPPLTVCSNICCTSQTEMWQVQVIQIDEAALQEGLPLRKSEQADYQNWAVHGFHITTSGVKDTTQIHTHMCYSNFNDIIHSIIDMDADVITIENSRSDEKLLSVFHEGVEYGAGIGPGVYDIHSPRIPSTEEMAERACKMLAVLESKVLWINSDCRLKTRKYTEVVPALTNMVNAAKQLRTELAK